MNPSICYRECEKSRDVGKYLHHEKCKCRKNLIYELVEECSEDIDGNEMIDNVTLNDYERVCNGCTIYIVLLIIFFVKRISISSAFIYFYRYLKRINVNTSINTSINAETIIY